MKIKPFNKFITEKFGVSNPSLIFENILFLRTYGTFIEFLKGDKKTNSFIEEINYTLLKPFIKDLELYSEFPVSKFELNLSFKKTNIKEYKRKYPKSDLNVEVGGFASPFGNKNWKEYSKIVAPVKSISDNSLIINIGISVEISTEFNIKDAKQIGKLKDDISSTIYHELNHSFEYYKRAIANKNVVRPENRAMSTTLSIGNNLWKFPKEIYRKWNFLIYYIYISESHETSANVQELSYFIKKYPNKDLSDIRGYDLANKMENFNAEIFYKELIDKISEYKPYKGDEELIANRLKEMWVSEYEKECKSQKIKPIVNINSLKKISCLDFIKILSKRIQKAGRKIKRKSLRLKHSM